MKIEITVKNTLGQTNVLYLYCKFERSNKSSHSKNDSKNYLHAWLIKNNISIKRIPNLINIILVDQFITDSSFIIDPDDIESQDVGNFNFF